MSKKAILILDPGRNPDRQKSMQQTDYLPIYELARGMVYSSSLTAESTHFGAVAVVESTGRLVAWHANPHTVTFMRSSAKPFQAIPLVERIRHTKYNLTSREIALICASHSGTETHVQVLQGLQEKTGVSEDQMSCGTHPPIHEDIARTLLENGQAITPNRHNCSGKHTAMLALARLENHPTETYLDPTHPVQKIILETFAEMCSLRSNQVQIGIDGCSAPNFAIPLYNAALAFARLCDPNIGQVTPAERANACLVITQAMISHPDMVAGPSRFDTDLMVAAKGRLLAKGGAEGYQGLGILPGALGKDSPALGVAIKISDGDSKGRALPAVSLEILRQLGALSRAELKSLSAYGPGVPVRNWRDIVVGEGKPCFRLKRHQELKLA